MTEIEKEVSEAIAADPNYPLGEPDAMKWAVAWRLIRDRNGINANASNMPGEEIDEWMLGWFANCMASAHPSMLMVHNNVSDQCDQDAAKAWWNKPVMVGTPHVDDLAQAFAHHRIAAAQAERAAVVEYLRSQRDNDAADYIEAGEHRA